MESIEERYKLCVNCTERVAAGKCAGKCKEYWKALGAEEQKSIDDEEQGKALLYAVHKTTERTKREMIDKTCEWLKEHIYDYIAVGNTDFGKPYDIDLCSDELFKDFKKAVEE